jgi:quercetin 2,3-dioxygenase
MTAGAGILHKEYHEQKFAEQGGPFQMAQLWVNLPRAHKMTAPRYQPIQAAQMGIVELADNAGSVRVLAGEYQGVQGPALTFSPIRVFDVRLNAGGEAHFEFPARDNVALLVMTGSVLVNGTHASANDFIVFENTGEKLSVVASSGAQLLLLSGEPIDEPLVQYGPFVMNTDQEIRQAIADYNAGKFGVLDE